MARLTKAEEKAHDEALALINLERDLTYDEIDFVHDNFHAAASHMVAKNAAFFTPRGLAYAVAYMGLNSGHVVDLGAGIGTLSWEMWKFCRGDIQITCVEFNPDYVEVGKRLLPQATWIRGSIFDLNVLRKIGTVGGVISNPPYGTAPDPDNERKWLSYQGPLHLQAVEVACRISETGATMILPRIDLPYEESMYKGDWDKARYTPRGFQPRTGYEEKEQDRYSQSLKKFFKVYPDIKFASTSWPIEEWEDSWRGTKPLVELVSIDRGDNAMWNFPLGLPRGN